MRILLIGAKGQLAEDLHRVLAQEEVVAVSHADLEIRDQAAVRALVERMRPETIINTAAFNLVDACEDQAEEAFGTNATGVYNVARAAQQVGAVMVHFSTNYVFDGAKRTPYVEMDPASPLSIYGMSKLAGERIVQQYCERYFVLRTAGLYGIAGNWSKGGNFIERMLRRAEEGEPLRVVNDQFLNPTSSRELAERFSSLLGSKQYGLYHMTNTGECSWYEFACEAFRQLGLSPDLTPISTEALGAKARRPTYSVLENQALRAAGLADFRAWQEALSEYVRERRHR